MKNHTNPTKASTLRGLATSLALAFALVSALIVGATVATAGPSTPLHIPGAVANPTKGVAPLPCISIALPEHGTPAWGGLDSSGHIWTYASGRVLGYAVEEDSTIYTTPQCAHTAPAYCQREERGEVIGYPAGHAVRPGFEQVACPIG